METTTPQPVNGSAGEIVYHIPGHGAMVRAAFNDKLNCDPPKRTRKIAILGFGETVKDCPWRDDSWELWGMNGFWRADKADYGIEAPESRYTLWFDMHSVAYTRSYGEAAGFGDRQVKWLETEHSFPVFMLEECPEFPSVRRFPIEDVVEKLGRDYFTSSVAYCLAYALTLPDVAEIGLWGIDLTHSTEYAQQRPCAEYWVGRAEAMGLKVTIHEESALLKQRFRYGYEDESPLFHSLRNGLNAQLKQATDAMAKNQAQLESLRNQLHTDDGAVQAFRGLLNRLDSWEKGASL